MEDSKEQNGYFNMTMIDTKRKILVLKREHCLNESVDKSDIILLINIAWKSRLLVLIRTVELLPIEDGGHKTMIFLPFLKSELQ